MFPLNMGLSRKCSLKPIHWPWQPCKIRAKWVPSAVLVGYLEPREYYGGCWLGGMEGSYLLRQCKQGLRGLSLKSSQNVFESIIHIYIYNFVRYILGWQGWRLGFWFQVFKPTRDDDPNWTANACRLPLLLKQGDCCFCSWNPQLFWNGFGLCTPWSWGAQGVQDGKRIPNLPGWSLEIMV